MDVGYTSGQIFLSMHRTAPNMDAVTAVIDDVCQTLVLPRFSKLLREDIEPKSTPADPDDIVTIVDRQVEERLSNALRALTPSVPIIGEEAAYDRPEMLSLLSSDDPVWLIDPIDGTKNFASGDKRFGIMLAWVVRGEAQAAWIALPALKQLFVAEAGSGSFLNGSRIQVPRTPLEDEARGVLLVRYMPGELGNVVAKAMRGRFRSEDPGGCAAVEYTDIIQGKREFVIYYRLLPWDHAAPALILTEAGGGVLHLDGSAYTVRSKNRVTVVVRDAHLGDQVRSWLEPHVTVER
jgi:fructose-1,6-bisphosphatase/inositol monophosphatase family enzyme